MATGVPSNIIVPFVGVEFDASRAFSGPATMPVTALLVGQMTASGTGAVDTKYLVTSADEVADYGGFGSQIHRMAIKYFLNNNVTTTYIIMQADAGGSAAATTTITMGGTTAATAGEVVLYIAGDRVATSVAVGDTFDEVAAAIVVAVNAEVDLPVTVAYATPTLTFTAKNKGVNAGDLDIRKNYNAGEADISGITVTINAITPGTGDPDVQDVLDVIGDTWFNIIAHPYNDTTNLDLIEDFALVQTGPLVMKDGVWYSAKRDTRANMITFGTSTDRNNQYVVLLPSYNRLESTYELSAAVVGRTAESIQSDTAVPLHRMTLSGLKTVSEDDRWTTVERNQLAIASIATITDTNGVQTESTVTMYLKNSAGASDTAYQFQNTVFVLMDLRYTWVQWILSKYPRAKLANNADVIKAGQQVMTPDVGKAESIAWFKTQEREGKVENLDLFKKQIVVERNESNPNRLDFLLPPDLINQFIVGSGIMQFQLEASEG